jgi:O-antigen ligase
LKSFVNTKSFKPFNLAIVFFVFATVIPAISLSDYVNILGERYFFKGLGVVFLITSVVIMIWCGRGRTRWSEFFFLLAIITLPLVFAVSASIYEFSGSLVQWLRFVTVFLLVLFLCVLNESELLLCLKIYCFISAILVIISIYQFFVGYPAYEKFPVLNIRSNKSIIFEQNVYGLFVYMTLLVYGLINFDQKKLKVFGINLIYLFGIFISFYRTVYAFVLLRLFIKRILLSLIAIFILLYFSGFISILFEAFKLEQISTLTGRDLLWRIALDSFYSAPLIGLGENAIPEVSNAVLKRDPAFTTYHNVVLDVLAISGVVGFVVYSFLFVYFFSVIDQSHRFIYLLLMAPALANTYIAFMPNPLGGILGVFIFYSIRFKRNRKIKLRIANDG